MKWGSASYNLVHTLTGPVLFPAAEFLASAPRCIPYAPIWLAHIGFDRMLGFGLEYPTFFGDTHLQHD
jgi:hypothetical protein